MLNLTHMSKSKKEWIKPNQKEKSNLILYLNVILTMPRDLK